MNGVDHRDLPPGAIPWINWNIHNRASPGRTALRRVLYDLHGDPASWTGADIEELRALEARRDYDAALFVIEQMVYHPTPGTHYQLDFDFEWNGWLIPVQKEEEISGR